MKFLTPPAAWILLGALLVAAWSGCEQWDLERVAFLDVTTIDAIGDSPTSIVVQSEVSGLTGNAIVEQYGVVFSYYNPEPNLQDDYVIDQGERTEDGRFQTNIQDLAVDLPLYVRAFASSGGKLVYGNVLTATPQEIGLQIHMDSIVVSNTEINLFGYLLGSSSVSFPGHGFVWSSEREEPNVFEDEIWFIGPVNNEETIMEGQLPDPDPLAVYYVRAFVYSGPEVIYSPEVLTFSKGNAWRLLSDLSDVITDPQVVYNFQIDGNHYLALTNQFGIYDPADNSWEDLAPDHPTSPTVATATIEGEQALVHQLLQNWKYNAPADNWETIAPFPIADNRTSVSGFSLHEKGYMGLGTDGISNLSDVYRYVPGSDSWEAIDIFPGTAIVAREAFEFENKACFVTGFFLPDNDCWCYEEGLGWTQMANFPLLVSNYQRAYSFSIDHRAYLLLPDEVDNFWEYNSLTDTWTQKADFPGGYRIQAAAFAKNGRGYYGLGYQFFEDQFNYEIWEYIPEPE